MSTRPSRTARVFITGSADGLGRAADHTLLNHGHQVVIHACNRDRLRAVRDLLDRGAAAVLGDLSDLERLIYLTSGMHRGGRASLTGIHWSGHRATGSDSDSKLLVTTLAAGVAWRWAEVFSNAVDPGWVPTTMGGPGAPEDLRLGHLTQVWLATSEDPQARTSGGSWDHQRRTEPAPAVGDRRFQGQLLGDLAGFTATRLVCPGRAEARAIT